ncbi:hypothetical protein LZQ00_07270 [Sphingobacterium sp. SRCM116780]|uniref:hypothetical protein n=1 Tax=Sphingobacterium sp. SRCM116780 TaxID=2907623 RepID=UPI001F2C6053|nr:hypothetical protein [Sphingobacterium sp. SRCM116780]UIR57610.1 hypothetical protein LZQ00_07270 [Sphingobacterium sp. SRCM116780]
MKNKNILQALPLFLGGALLFWSCQSERPSNYKGSTKSKLSLDSFFNTEIEKLSKLNPTVEKTVIKDAEQEVKSLKISNWKNELSGFISADITKDADPTLYDFQEIDCKMLYKAKDKHLAIQYLSVEHNLKGNIKEVVIERKTDNSLYSSKEKLIYVVDSIYEIEKNQDILVLGDSHYKIIGKLK